MISLLRSRRSIRHFQGNPVSAEHRATLEEALLRSPSSRGLNPWEFVFIDDRNVLTDLSRCKPRGASFLTQAPLCLVVLGDQSKCDIWL